MKTVISIALVFLLLFCLTIPTFAHSGRTDSNGRHYDHSTGKYHYHHGYSAHQHPNGVCPYENNMDINNSNSSQKEAKEEPSKDEPTSFDYVLLFIFFLALIYAVSRIYKVFCE